MKVRFLLDENLSPKLKPALKRLDSQIDVIRVGDVGAPPLTERDPLILEHLTRSGRLLITDNRRTIPTHLIDHYNAGRMSHWGILWVRSRTSLGRLVATLHLIWEASEAEEWIDRAEWIPL